MTALDSVEPLEPDIDPALAALADAILIPPFFGTTPPPWLLRALGARARRSHVLRLEHDR